MENLLNEIIRSDKEAKKRLTQAEDYRREQLISLQSKKEEIEKEEIKKAVDDLLKKGQKRKSAGDKQISALKQSHKAAEDKMNELYKANGSKWVEKIVDGVING